MRSLLSAVSLLALTACSTGFSAAERRAVTTPASWQEIANVASDGLSEATRLAEAGRLDDAREMVSDIYFETFEGLGMETAIRSNISASRAFELEELFSEIRKGIGEGRTEIARLAADTLGKELQLDASRLIRLGVSVSS